MYLFSVQWTDDRCGTTKLKSRPRCQEYGRSDVHDCNYSCLHARRRLSSTDQGKDLYILKSFSKRRSTEIMFSVLCYVRNIVEIEDVR